MEIVSQTPLAYWYKATLNVQFCYQNIIVIAVLIDTNALKEENKFDTLYSDHCMVLMPVESHI